MFRLKIFIVCIILVLISCNNKVDEKNSNNTLTDRAGNTIKVPDIKEKLISLSPAITDVLVSLGVADKIIASDYTSVDILKNNNIDTSDILIFDMLNPDSEKIISLNPDILFVNNFSAFSGKNALDAIANAGICIVTIPNSDTLSNIENDISFLGEVLGLEDNAKEIVTNMQISIQKIKSIGETITNKKRVYFEIAALPNLYSFGTNVYLDDMINIIGAENIFKDKKQWITTSQESVIHSNPDIIFTSVHYVNSPVNEILDRVGWQNVNAIKNKQVYYLPSSSLPTHNIIESLIAMAKYTYPDVYKDIE